MVDAPELIRLRAVMLDSMGIDTGPADAPWRLHGVAVLEARLSDRSSFAGFVVDEGPELASSALAWIERHLPGPQSPHGWSGVLASVATDPRWRRRGLGRLCVTAADAWLAESAAPVAYLHATADGEAIYRSLGWSEPRYPNLLKRYDPAWR